MAKATKKPKGAHKAIEKAAIEISYQIDNLYYSVELSKVFGKRRFYPLADMPQSTAVALIALRDDLDRLFGVVDKKKSKISN